MVTSEKEEVFRVFDFVSEEETNCFKWLFASVYIVSEEKIVRFWREASILKKSE